MKGSRNPFVRIHLRVSSSASRRVRDRYRGFLEARLEHPGRFALIFLLCCLLSLGLAPFLGRDFFPLGRCRRDRAAPAHADGHAHRGNGALTDRVDQRVRQLIPKNEVRSIIDNIGLPVSGINLSYSNTGTIGSADADILITLNEDHKPTADYVRELRQRLPVEFPGVAFSFLPADIVSQILNFGVPAPIDIQIVGRDVQGNRAFAEPPAREDPQRAGTRRRAHPAALRPAVDLRRSGSHARRCRRASRSATSPTTC